MTSYRERIILKALWGIPTELKRGIEMEEKKNLWSSYDEAAKKELHEINEKYKGNFTPADRVLLTALREKLMGDKKLSSMAKSSDPQIFAESIFPKAFGDAAMESYAESQETYTALFEDQHKYNAIMNALAEVLYREMRKKK